MQLLGVMTFGAGAGAVGVALFAMDSGLLAQPMVGRLLVHGILGTASGFCCFVTGIYGMWPTCSGTQP